MNFITGLNFLILAAGACVLVNDPGSIRQSASMHSNPGGNAVHDGSEPRIVVRATDTAHAVSPTSERIIKETSVKRRQAIKVLANR